MRLECGLGQITLDSTWGNGLDDLPADDFCGQFSPGPVVDGQSRLTGFFAGDRKNVRDLFGREHTRRTGAGRVAENVFNGAAECGLPMTDPRERMREVQRMADRVCTLILSSDLPAIDIEIAKSKVRERCLELYPDREELYEMVYESRFQRLWNQFREEPTEL